MPFAAQHIRTARNHLRKSDPKMAKIIKAVGPFKAETRRDRFTALARAIVYQQISGKAAASIWDRLADLLQPATLDATSLRACSLEELRSAGISRQKGTYLKDLADRVFDGDIQLNQLGRKTDEDVIQVLTQVKGIGRWTAQIFLMFTLNRLDVLPVDDLGIKTAMKQAYNLDDLPDAKVMQALAEPWRPYATVASWYLWRSLEVDW